MKVWITKYALTSGTFTTDEAVLSRTSPDMISFKRSEASYPEHFHGEGREWHRTEQSARDRFWELKDKKIASLRNKISELEKLPFKTL